MKKLFFVSGVIVCMILGCSSSKDLKGPFPKPTKAEDFFTSPNALSEKEAKAMVHLFPIHKYHVTHKKRLLYTSSYFDTADVRKVFTNPNVDSVFFFLSALVDTGVKHFATVIMVIKIKTGISIVFEDANHSGWTFIQVANREFANTYNTIQYIKGTGYCPPPSPCASHSVE
jgi:hypothetical protein